MDTAIITKAAEQQKAVAAKPKKDNSIRGLIGRMQGEIAKALPSVITPERFTRITLSALSTNPKLSECTSESFLASMMTAAQLGVEPNTPLGQAYLIPYNNHGKLECQFQLGYKGLLDLAYRSGEIKTIYAETVYENDDFQYELGLEPKLIHRPAASNRGNPVYFYAVFKTQNGGEAFSVMSLEDAQEHAKKYSQAYRSGYSSPWKTNFEEMAKKTVLKKCLKYAPLKTDFVKALSTDETIKTTISEDMYAEPDRTVIDSETGEVIEPDAKKQQ